MDECKCCSNFFLGRVLSFVEIQDVTGLLLDTESSEDIVHNTLRAQVTCLWLLNASYLSLTSSSRSCMVKAGRLWDCTHPRSRFVPACPGKQGGFCFVSPVRLCMSFEELVVLLGAGSTETSARKVPSHASIPNR